MQRPSLPKSMSKITPKKFYEIDHKTLDIFFYKNITFIQFPGVLLFQFRAFNYFLLLRKCCQSMLYGLPIKAAHIYIEI